MQLADGRRDMLSQLLLQILQDFVIEGHQLWQRGRDSFGTCDQTSQRLQQGSAWSAAFALARGAEQTEDHCVPLFSRHALPLDSVHAISRTGNLSDRR